MRHQGIWSVQEFQDELENSVWEGVLPIPAVHKVEAELLYKAYREVNNKMAKRALLEQLSCVLAGLRLRNPAKRIEKIIEGTGIEKTFALALITAHTNKKAWRRI